MSIFHLVGKRFSNGEANSLEIKLGMIDTSMSKIIILKSQLKIELGTKSGGAFHTHIFRRYYTMMNTLVRGK